MDPRAGCCASGATGVRLTSAAQLSPGILRGSEQRAHQWLRDVEQWTLALLSTSPIPHRWDIARLRKGQPVITGEIEQLESASERVLGHTHALTHAHTLSHTYRFSVPSRWEMTGFPIIEIFTPRTPRHPDATAHSYWRFLSALVDAVRDEMYIYCGVLQ